MTIRRLIQRSLPLAAVAVAAAAPAAFAQGQELFEWRGRVDREIQIVMRAGSVTTNRIGQNESNRAQARAISRLPNQEGQVTVQLLNGRGSADVIQQPSRQNGYTTIVRILDPVGGAGDYRLAAYWQAYASGDVSGNNGNGRGYGRGRANGNNGNDRVGN